nr:hypothetical protein Iba_chr13eCG7530 [Ipomoea batatas]
MQKEIYASLAARLEDFTLERYGLPTALEDDNTQRARQVGSQQIPLDHENLNSARGALAGALEDALVDLEGKDEEPGFVKARSARLTKRGGRSTPDPSKRHLVYLVRRHGRLVHSLGRLYAHFDCAVRPRLTKCLKKHDRPTSREKGDWLAPNLL